MNLFRDIYKYMIEYISVNLCAQATSKMGSLHISTFLAPKTSDKSESTLDLRSSKNKCLVVKDN